MILHHMEQGSEAWFDVRLGRFTGSTIGKLLMGKSTAGYQNCIAEVTAQILTGEHEESYVSNDMQRGIDLEPEAANFYEDMFLEPLKEIGFVEPEHEIYGEYCGVSPDRLIGEDGLLEIKCPKAVTMFKYYQKDVLPAEYKAQVQFQLFITERKYCHFMAYYPRLKPFLISVDADIEYQKKIESELIIGVNEVKKQLEIYKEYTYE